MGKPAFTMHMASLLIAAIVAFLVLRIAAKRISIGHESAGNRSVLNKGSTSTNY